MTRSIFVFALVLPTTTALAQTQEQHTLLRPTTHALFATFHVGPAMEVAGDWGTQLKIGQDLGWHIDGTSSGLALGLSLEESFGNCTEGQGASCFSFQAGPKLWYDVQILDDLPLYIAPTARLAFTHVAVSAGSLSGGFTGAGIQLGLELRAVLSDRAVLFFRPVTFDVIIGDADQTLSYVYDDTVAMRYDLTFGGGVTF
jgi:hypothetical protein